MIFLTPASDVLYSCAHEFAKMIRKDKQGVIKNLMNSLQAKKNK
jgi:hypothetical protein